VATYAETVHNEVCKNCGLAFGPVNFGSFTKHQAGGFAVIPFNQ